MRHIAIAAMWMIVVSTTTARADPGSGAEITAQLGDGPMYCATTLPDRVLCTWHEARAFHLVCELDAAGKRTPAPCTRQPDNVQMSVFPAKQPGGPGTVVHNPKVAARGEVIAAARAELDAAQSLEQVVEAVGAGPVWCQRRDVLVCSWHAVRRTPGYLRLSRVADAPGSKVNLRCTFDAEGRSHAPGACAVTVGGNPEPTP